MKLKLSHLLILSSTILVATAGYFSITGFSQLFSGAYWPVVIMISGLEFAKLVTTSFLYQHGKYIKRFLRIYLTVFVGLLMIITSAGLYGFLSSAYSNTASKSTIIDQHIKQLESKKEVIEESNKRSQAIIDTKSDRVKTLTSLRQSQESRIDTLYKKGMMSGVKKTEQLIKDAGKEIEERNKEIDQLNKSIQSNSDSIGGIDLKIIELSNSDIKGEIGPLKYIATLTGKSTDSVVNFFILLLVFIYDPLAVCLVIATNKVLSEEKVVVEEEVEKVSKDYSSIYQTTYRQDD